MFILVALLIISFGMQGTSYGQKENPAITVSTSQPLTEASLNGSVVTLTLSGGIYGHWADVRESVKVSGIAGVTVPWHVVERVNDTRVRLILKFDSTDFDADTILTFTVDAKAIANYDGPPLTAKIPVTAIQEESPTIAASSMSPLAETTLDGSVVTLTLNRSTYTRLEIFIENALTISDIEDGAIGIHDVDRVSDTEVEVELTFNGNIDTDSTLTFILTADAITNYEGPPLTAKIPVIAVTESLTASTIVPLTETTLNASVVTLTLNGRASYKSSAAIKKALTISGIAGVTIFDFSIDASDLSGISEDISEINALDFVGIEPVSDINVYLVSDTEVRVRLRYDGTNIDTDATLTFTLGADAIVNYEGPPLIAKIPVSASTESIEASSVFPLTKGTLNGNIVTLTLSGATYKWFIFDTENVTVSGISGVTIRRTFGVRHVNETEITVELEFNGDFNTDSMLTFTVEKGLIASYNGPPLTAEISVTSAIEEQVLIREPQMPPMYWVNTKTRMLHSLTRGTIAPLLKDGLAVVTSLAVDTAGDKLYWTERIGVSAGRVKRVNLDGTNVELLATLSSAPIGIAIDSARNKLYWTNSHKAIQSASLNGENIRTVIQLEDEIIEKTSTSCAPKALGISVLWGLLDLDVGGGCQTETTRINLTSPTDIAVDPVGNKLYWIELSGRIRSVNFDGTNLNTFANDLGTPGGIAVTDGKIYWTEKTGENGGRIERADLNGTNVETLTMLQGIPAGISVDTVSGKVYWSNAYGGIQRTDINGGEIENVAFVTAPGDFVLATRIQQTGTATTTTDATVSISPASVISPAIGEQITFNLNIISGETIAGYQASVQFDATALRYVSGTNGDYLPAGAFFVDSVVEGNLVKLNTASLAGESNGDGTLATLTFEIVDAKASTLILSDVLLSNRTGETSVPQVGNAQITEPTGLKEDVNADGSVNIADLVLVASNLGKTGQNTADVNSDGQVNIADLVLVAGALGASAAAPSLLHPDSLEMLTFTDVRRWLSQVQHMDLTDPTSQRGILFLEQLLATLIPKETVLLVNYPNPFNPETWIPYQLAKPAEVTITIYAVNGRVVRRLALGHQPVGMYRERSRAVYWDGRNTFGESVASGVYFYTLTADDFTATRKMLIRK